MKGKNNQDQLKDTQQLKQEIDALKSLCDQKTKEGEALSERLKALELMLKPKRTASTDFVPDYGDLSDLNEDGLIRKSIPKHQLQDIVSEYLDLLETSAAIYEKNGDYALGIFSSGWCRMMDAASRKLCNTDDNREALDSGKWLCHDSCWKDASLKSMTEGKPVEVACNGGINLYAVPVRANKQIIGAINFGFGSPPKDDAELKKLSKTYKIPLAELHKQSNDYTDRPRFVIDYAKQRIEKSAQYLGYLVERKLEADAIEEIKERHRTTFYSIGDGVITTDKDGRITNMNPASEHYCGWTFDEAVNRPMSEVFRIVNAKTRKKVADPAKKVLKSKKVIGLANHTVLISKSGKEYQIADTAAPIKNRDDEITGVVLVFSDVTREYSMREKLRQSEERLNFAMMVKNDGMWDWDLIRNTTFFDDRYYTMAGYAHNDFPQTFEGWADKVHPDDLEAAQAAIKAYLGGASEKYDIEFRFRRKDGQWMWIQGQGKVIERDSKGKPARMIGTHTDITERKSAEERLQKSVQRLESFLQISQSITSTLDQDKIMQKIVDDAINVMGLDSGAIYIRNDEKTIKLVSTTPALPADFPEAYRIAPIKEHPSVESVFKAGDYVIMPDSITAKLTPAEREIINLRKLRSSLFLPIRLREEVIGVLILSSINRKYEFVKEDISLLQGFANQAAQVINNIQNFNELKKHTDKLKESEERFRNIMASMQDTVFTLDTKQRHTGVYGPWVEQAGASPEFFLGKTSREILGDANAEVHENANARALKGEFVVYDWSVTNENGKFYFQTSLSPIRDKNGDIQGLVGIGRNFTELKVAEEALRESEEQHRRLFETMSQGVIYQAADGSIVSANPAAEKMLGLSLDQMRGKTSMDPRWKMITEDGKKVKGKDHPVMIVLRTGEKVGPVTRGIYIPEKDEYVWLSITATPLFRPGEDKPFQSYAVFDDITFKKQQEDEIKKQQQLIHTILGKLPIGIAINTIDSEPKVELVNEN